VERKVITPSMQEHLKHLFNPDSAVADSWITTRNGMEVQHMRERVKNRAIEELRREIGQAEDLTFSCTFEGETEVVIGQGHAWWTCPVCGEEHDDTSGPLVDPDPPYDTWKEAEGLA
jgi:hypothetical protein